MYLGGLSGPASNDDCPHRRCPKGIVVNLNRVAGDICSILSVRTAVHVEAVAVGVGKDKIVTRLVARAWPACTCDMVTAPVEEIRLDKGVRLVEANTIAQTLALIMVNVVVVDMCLHGPTFEKHRRVTPTT